MKVLPSLGFIKERNEKKIRVSSWCDGIIAVRFLKVKEDVVKVFNHGKMGKDTHVQEVDGHKVLLSFLLTLSF